MQGKHEKSKGFSWGRGSGGVKSAGVSQSVRETGRGESQSVPSPDTLFKTRDLELPNFEGSVPSCSPHSAGYTRTSVHPYFPVANFLVAEPLKAFENTAQQAPDAPSKRITAKRTIKTYFFDLLSWGGPAFDLFNEVKRVRFDGAFCNDTF